MIESWRWYGPDLDRITLAQIAQTGARGIVHALHEIPYGEVWSREAIAARRRMIEDAGHRWVVVESLPVHERIKRGEGDLGTLLANYRQSMANLAAEGLTTICYNFMPLIDWTRTDLQAPVEGGGTCLRFDAARMCAFELHILGREEDAADYPSDVRERAKAWFDRATEADRDRLLASIMAGLPGAYDRYDVAQLREALTLYDGIGHDDLRGNYRRFLEEIIPAAQDLGMRFAVHPDDPPRDILGLPRIVSNAKDIEWIMQAVDAPENGLTLCSGSLGANPTNDVPAIARQFADRIHFAHLRNTRAEQDGSFEEAAHLEGDTNMVALCRVLLEATEGRDVAWRPDHGHELLSDEGARTFPGYPLIGRLRGLAEIRGVLAALDSRPG